MPTIAPRGRQRIGLALPALRTVGGYFATKSAVDTAWGDLLLTLFTPKGARPMRRQFGSNLHEVLFEPNTVENEPLIEYMVQAAAREFCPNVTVDRVQIARAGKTVQLRITFSLTESADAQVRTVEVNRDHIVRILAQSTYGA